MQALIETFFARKEEYLQALIEHMQLSFISLLFAALIAIPLAIYLTSHRKLAESLLQVTGIFQTIPSLALLGLLIPLIGIGRPPAIVALVIYALFPILQNTYTGLTEIDPSLEEAAEAFGMSKKEKLFKFELQMALPFIISGIRTATVLIIGTATLAALIGAGGLGTFILLGIDRNNLSLIFIGALSSAALAVLFNYGIHWLEKANGRRLIIGGTILGLLLGGSFFWNQQTSSKEKQLTIAGKLGAEPDIIINMYKALIEENSDIQVTLKPNFGKTTFLYNALKSDEIDLYPEFTGTVIETFLKNPPQLDNQPQISNQLKAGFTLEFIDRQDGYKGLQEKYHLNLNVQSMEPALRYQAINNGEVNVIDAYSTDSELKQYDLVTLEDDQALFPPYQGAPLIKTATLEKYPELAEILNKLAGKISEEEMSEMNYQVNVEGQDPSIVAKDFLKEKNLLK